MSGIRMPVQTAGGFAEIVAIPTGHLMGQRQASGAYALVYNGGATAGVRLLASAEYSIDTLTATTNLQLTASNNVGTLAVNSLFLNGGESGSVPEPTSLGLLGLGALGLLARRRRN